MEISRPTLEQYFARYKQVMDAYLKKGGLDPEEHRMSHIDDSPKLAYDFKYDFPAHFISTLGQVPDDYGSLITCIYAGVIIAYLQQGFKFEFCEEHLRDRLGIPYVFKISDGSDGDLTLNFLVSLDEVSDSDIFELLDILKVKSKSLLREFESDKGLKLIEVKGDSRPKYPT